MQEELKVKLADAKACYANASDEVKEALEHLFGAEPFAFNYREIKSFEDACKHLGISTELPAQRAGVEYCKEAVEQSLAAYKLMVICKAINNGQQYDEDGDTWFPVYWFYTKKELEDMGEDERKRKGIQLLSAANAYSTEHAGVRVAAASHRGASTYAYCGFPLCANSEEKALYLDEQFSSLIYQCYGIKVKEEE